MMSRITVKTILLLTIMLSIAWAWQFTVLKDWLSPQAISSWVTWLSTKSMAPVILIAAYVLSGIVLLPNHLLTIAAGVAFGSMFGFIYATIGNLAAAGVTLWIGRLLNQDLVNRLAGTKLHQIMEQLKRKGLLAVLFLRILPIAPFSVANVVAGAAGIRMRDMLLGTFIGTAPCIVLSVFFGAELTQMLSRPTATDIALLAGVILLSIAGSLYSKRLLKIKTRE